MISFRVSSCIFSLNVACVDTIKYQRVYNTPVVSIVSKRECKNVNIRYIVVEDKAEGKKLMQQIYNEMNKLNDK